VSERNNWETFRPWPVYMMAAVVPISLAATSVSKLLVFLFGLVSAAGLVGAGQRLPQLRQLRTPAVILLMLAALAFSLVYTTGPLLQALNDFGKYGKLLVIPLVLVLVRTRREAMIGLVVYGAAQFLVVLTSYLLSMGLELPWVMKDASQRLSIGTVYSSYIDQSIMTAGLAALCWNLRNRWPGRAGPAAAIAVAVLCAVNVLFFLPGRSGHAALLVAMALALYWAIPRHGKWVALVVPAALLAAAMALSPQFSQRTYAIVTQSQAYLDGDRSPWSSAGTRLNYWYRALQAIEERPLLGSGVGSWNTEYRRLEGAQLNPHLKELRNPHQEYLMWGVQLGLVGIALLLAFFVQLARDAKRLDAVTRQAAYSMAAMLAVVCLFNSTIFDALIGDYFCVMIGLLLALGFTAAPAQSETNA